MSPLSHRDRRPWCGLWRQSQRYVTLENVAQETDEDTKVPNEMVTSLNTLFKLDYDLHKNVHIRWLQSNEHLMQTVTYEYTTLVKAKRGKCGQQSTDALKLSVQLCKQPDGLLCATYGVTRVSLR